jgi:hypothetical protein
MNSRSERCAASRGWKRTCFLPKSLTRNWATRGVARMACLTWRPKEQEYAARYRGPADALIVTRIGIRRTCRQHSPGRAAESAHLESLGARFRDCQCRADQHCLLRAVHAHRAASGEWWNGAALAIPLCPLRFLSVCRGHTRIQLHELGDAVRRASAFGIERGTLGAGFLTANGLLLPFIALQMYFIPLLNRRADPGRGSPCPGQRRERVSWSARRPGGHRAGGCLGRPHPYGRRGLFR